MNNPIAIHESRDSEKVVKFIELDHFTASFQEEYNNNNFHGCYYDEAGKIVAIDGQGETLHNII